MSDVFDSNPDKALAFLRLSHAAKEFFFHGGLANWQLTHEAAYVAHLTLNTHDEGILFEVLKELKGEFNSIANEHAKKTGNQVDDSFINFAWGSTRHEGDAFLQVRVAQKDFNEMLRPVIEKHSGIQDWQEFIRARENNQDPKSRGK